MWIALYLSLLCGVASTAPLSCDHACTVGINTQGCICISGPLLKLIDEINNENLNLDYMTSSEPEIDNTNKVKRTSTPSKENGRENIAYNPVFRWGKRSDHASYKKLFRWGKRSSENSFDRLQELDDNLLALRNIEQDEQMLVPEMIDTDKTARTEQRLRRGRYKQRDRYGPPKRTVFRWGK